MNIPLIVIEKVKGPLFFCDVVFRKMEKYPLGCVSLLYNLTTFVFFWILYKTAYGKI